MLPWNQSDSRRSLLSSSSGWWRWPNLRSCEGQLTGLRSSYGQHLLLHVHLSRPRSPHPQRSRCGAACHASAYFSKEGTVLRIPNPHQSCRITSECWRSARAILSKRKLNCHRKGERIKVQEGNRKRMRMNECMEDSSITKSFLLSHLKSPEAALHKHVHHHQESLKIKSLHYHLHLMQQDRGPNG